MTIYAVAISHAFEGGWPQKTMYRDYHLAMMELLALVAEENNEDWRDEEDKLIEKDEHTWTDGDMYIELHEFELE